MPDMDVQTRWLMAAGALMGALVLGYLARSVVIGRIAALVSRTETDFDDVLLAATRRQVPFWFFLGGLVVAARLAPLSERALLVVDRISSVGLVLSLCVAAATLGTEMLGHYTARAGTTVATTSLTQNVLRVLIYLTGGLLILSNLFAGLHLAFARPVSLGDDIALENGMKGTVDDIGWRTTQLRDPVNNLIIVPNARVVDMIVTNYSRPRPEQSVPVELGVAYHSDLSQVERVVYEVARGVQREVEGAVREFEPVVRYTALGDSAVRVTAVLRVSQFGDRVLVTHEFLKRILARFAQEGIEVPFPQRVVRTVEHSAT